MIVVDASALQALNPTRARAARGPLLCGLDQLDVFLEECIDEIAQRYAAGLSAQRCGRISRSTEGRHSNR
jgi:hypothetical protein